MTNPYIYPLLTKRSQLLVRTGYNFKEPDRIVDIVSDVLSLNQSELLSKSRVREFVEARAIICHVLNKLFNMGVTKIGRLINRDHSTVIVALKNYDNWYKYDIIFKEKADLIKKISLNKAA